jgi:PAS domain S-box-containing protein
VTIPIPVNETERLEALHRYKILDTPPEEAFDRITKLASQIFNMPIALVSLVDESRAWFKSCIGFAASEVARNDTLCSFAVLTDEPLIIPDARLDDRFACNSFVRSEPGIRFYAGAPLLSHDGFNLGTLCMLDSQPRDPLTAEQQATLVDLAAIVVDELELRLAAHKIAQVDAALLEITRGIATVTGEAFFNALVQHFAKVLDANYVYIGLVQGDNPKKMRTIATYAHGQIVENMEYLLKDTPCWEAIEQRKICCYPRKVQTRFPNAPLLKPLSVESYVATPFFDSNGTALGLLGVMDGKPIENVQLAESLLTIFASRIATELERQQTEIILRESEKQKRNIIESIKDGFFALDENWQFTYVNQAAEILTERDAEDLIGKNFWEEFPEMIGSEFKQLYRGVMDDRTAATHTAYYPNRDRWYEVNAYPAVNGITVYFKNVTDRKIAELEREALLTRERQYLDRLQGLTAAALVINSALSVEELLQTITYQAAAIVGTHQSVISVTNNYNWSVAIDFVYLSDKYSQWRDYEKPNDRLSFYQCVCHLNRSMRMNQAELKTHPCWEKFGKEADKYPPMRDFLAAPLVKRDGQNIGLIQLSDKYEGEFTETDEWILVQLAQMASIAIENARLYEAEQQARSIAETAREEAQAANNIKDEFLAVLSHELRSPLNPILGWTHLIQKGKLNPAQQVEALKTIERNANLQLQLIEDLLDISRIMQGKLSLTPTSVNLNFVISAALETVRLAAEAKNIQISLDLANEFSVEQKAGSIPAVSGDAARLQQVVWNLLTNAVKFTPRGGRVTIELRQLDSLAQIRVVDTGKGIQPQFLPYVFEYFRQEDGSTTRKFGGLGLGLAIVRQIVEMHGGKVWADSKGENQGATFTVQLPLNLETRSSQPEILCKSSMKEAPLSNLQILLVDDDMDTREFEGFLLEHNGASVTAVASGVEALQALDCFVPDIIVSDVGMAEMDGYMLIQQIRSLPSNRGGLIPAIALTAYAGEFDRQKALQVGFQKHLTKPLDPQTLIEAIAALIWNK